MSHRLSVWPWRTLGQGLLQGAVVLAASLGATAAWAAGNEIEGRGFAARLPAGFKPGRSAAEDGSDIQTFRRRADGGELTLTFVSFEQSSRDTARLEVELARVLDGSPGELSAGQGEASSLEARVAGAEEAHEGLARGEDESRRTLVARLEDLIVSVTLTSPAAAENEAVEAWSSVVASLRVEPPGKRFATWALVGLGSLAGLAVALRLARSRGAPTAAPAAAPSDPYALPTAAPEAYHPVPMPGDAAPLSRGPGGGFSRADDGLPVFGAENKARGGAEVELKLPAVTRRVPSPPVTAPSEAPRTRVPVLRPPTPAFRI